MPFLGCEATTKTVLIVAGLQVLYEYTSVELMYS